MNKESKETILFNKKLQACSHELATLLDLIYKFPQQQRQKFYDRIQLLKQNLTQLEICVSDVGASGGFGALEKKYQQVFIKINELKGEINGCEVVMPAKKKRVQGNSHQSSYTMEGTFYDNKEGSRQLGKGKYDSIMQTIVQKDQQVRKYKNEVDKYRHIINQLEDRQNKSQVWSKNVQAQLSELRSAHSRQASHITTLQHQLEQLTDRNSALSLTLTQYQTSTQASTTEISKLQSMLAETIDECRLRKMEAESSVIKLAAFQEKYRYEVKGYMEREDQFRMKEKGYDARIGELERRLEQVGDADGRNRELIAENARMKEDIHVLETQLALKEEVLYDKNRKLEWHKGEMLTMKGKQEQKQKQVEKKQMQIQQLLITQKQNQDVILMLQRKIRQLQKYLAECQQEKLLVERKMRNFEKELQQVKGKFGKSQEQLRRCEGLLQQKIQTLTKLGVDKQKAQKQYEFSQLQMAKKQKKLDQLNKILVKIQQQKGKHLAKTQQCTKQIKNRQETIKTYQKQIQSLKKRLLRAKIETIHNIREVLA